MKAPLRNIMSLLSGDAATRGIGFLISVYLARVLAPESFGVISVGMSVLAYLVLANGPGIQLVETRNAAATPGGLNVRTGAVLAMRISTVVPLLALTAVVMIMGKTPEATRTAVLIFGVSLVPFALSLEWFFQGKEAFPSLTFSRIGNVLVYGLCCLAFVASSGDIVHAGLAFLAGNLTGVLWLGVLYVKRFGMPEFRWDPASWWAIFRENAPVGGAAFLAQSSVNLPPLVTAWYLGTVATGNYSAAMKLVLILLSADRLVNALFLPLVSRLVATKEEEVSHLLTVALKTMVVTILPALLMAYHLAMPAIAAVFGVDYGEAVPVFRILTGYVGLTMLNSLLVCTLLAYRKTGAYSRIVSTGALVFAAGAFVLTPILGLAGTAMSVVIGEAVDLVLLARAVARVVTLPRISEFLRIIPAAAVGVGVSLAGFGSGEFERAVISGMVFSVVLWLSGGIPAAELRFLRERII
jgi:O-antigen/teichoic acid export membrane protein